MILLFKFNYYAEDVFPCNLVCPTESHRSTICCERFASDKIDITWLNCGRSVLCDNFFDVIGLVIVKLVDSSFFNDPHFGVIISFVENRLVRGIDNSLELQS